MARRPATPNSSRPAASRPPRSAARRKRQRRREQQRLQATPAGRFNRWWVAAGGVAGVAVLAVLLILLTRGHAATSTGSATTPAPTPAPTVMPSALAALDAAAGGSASGTLQCTANPNVTSRTTAHLAIYVNGAARGVPAGVGVGTPRTTTETGAGPVVSGKCYYPVSTRTADGLVVIEPPTGTTASYTLGQLFNLWGLTLNGTQVGPATGAVTVAVNGTVFTGDPATVPLTKHAVIQISVGSTTPFQAYTFPPGD